MAIADQFPGTNLTVGQPVGWLGWILTAVVVILARVAIDVVAAVHHKISISGPARRAARQDVDDHSSDDGTSGQGSRGGRTSSCCCFIFFRFPPPPFSFSERNLGQKSWDHTINRGSFLEIKLLHGSQKPESRATLKSNFLWNFGTGENRVVSIPGLVLSQAGLIWPVSAVSVMASRG